MVQGKELTESAQLDDREDAVSQGAVQELDSSGETFNVLAKV
jgi:hypothetical protein